MKQNSSEDLINKILSIKLELNQCLVLSLNDVATDKQSAFLLKVCGKRVTILTSNTYDFYLYHKENIKSPRQFKTILNRLLTQHKHSRLYLYTYPYKKKIPFVAGSIYPKESVKELLVKLPNYKENLYELKVKSWPECWVQLFSFDFCWLKIIFYLVYFYILYMDWKTIFMNISSDNVIISDGGEINISLSRNSLENILWRELVKLHKEIWFQNVIVLNWPWWFTNLRVGTLCLDVLNTLLKNQINIFSISKIDLYQMAYKFWILPKYWVIYIWQKRNVRLRDFEKNEKIWQYSFDELKEDEILTSNSIFLDEVFDDKYYPEWMNSYTKVKASFDWNNLIVNDEELSIESLWLLSVKSIAPNYMMEPSVTLK